MTNRKVLNADRSASGMVPGVIDGPVKTFLDPDGDISFHVTIGIAGDHAEEGGHIEFILSPEHAGKLDEMLVNEIPTSSNCITPSIPCRIGVRLKTLTQIRKEAHNSCRGLV